MTIEELERLVAGQGSETAPSRSQTRNVPLTSLPSFKRDVRNEILCAVWYEKRRMSRAQIAKALKLKKTTYLNALIEELVSLKLLRRIEVRWKNGEIMYYYELA